MAWGAFLKGSRNCGGNNHVEEQAQKVLLGEWMALLPNLSDLLRKSYSVAVKQRAGDMALSKLAQTVTLSAWIVGGVRFESRLVRPTLLRSASEEYYCAERRLIWL